MIVKMCTIAAKKAKISYLLQKAVKLNNKNLTRSFSLKEPRLIKAEAFVIVKESDEENAPISVLHSYIIVRISTLMPLCFSLSALAVISTGSYPQRPRYNVVAESICLSPSCLPCAGEAGSNPISHRSVYTVCKNNSIQQVAQGS